MGMVKEIVRFFDRLEDTVRGKLSHQPILYALIGGVGIVLFWKGVWEIASLFAFLNGFGSVIFGAFILLITGLLVSFFIGDSIILSGFKQEKKLAEKTEMEVLADKNTDQKILEHLEVIEKKLDHQESHHAKEHQK